MLIGEVIMVLVIVVMLLDFMERIFNFYCLVLI